MLSRRSFLSNTKRYIRPPYSGQENDFVEKCLKCSSQACVSSCENEIIVLEQTNIPYLDFSNNGCELCEDCVNACDGGALSFEHFSGIQAEVKISMKECIAHNKVICSLCRDSCLDDAIVFHGMLSPIIDMDKCTSCGYCISKCPTKAISII